MQRPVRSQSSTRPDGLPNCVPPEDDDPAMTLILIVVRYTLTSTARTTLTLTLLT